MVATANCLLCILTVFVGRAVETNRRIAVHSNMLAQRFMLIAVHSVELDLSPLTGVLAVERERGAAKLRRQFLAVATPRRVKVNNVSFPRVLRAELFSVHRVDNLQAPVNETKHMVTNGPRNQVVICL